MPTNKSCLYVFLIIRLPDFIAVPLIRSSSITSDICRDPYNEVCPDQFWQGYSRMQQFSYNPVMKICLFRIWLLSHLCKMQRNSFHRLCYMSSSLKIKSKMLYISETLFVETHVNFVWYNTYLLYTYRSPTHGTHTGQCRSINAAVEWEL
jgi:hypothetical protein